MTDFKTVDKVYKTARAIISARPAPVMEWSEANRLAEVHNTKILKAASKAQLVSHVLNDNRIEGLVHGSDLRNQQNEKFNAEKSATIKKLDSLYLKALAGDDASLNAMAKLAE